MPYNIQRFELQNRDSTNTNTWFTDIPDGTQADFIEYIEGSNLEIVSGPTLVVIPDGPGTQPQNIPIGCCNSGSSGGGFDPKTERSFATGMTFGPVYSLDNSRTWAQLKSEYIHIGFRFNVRVTGVTEDVLRIFYVHADDIVDNSKWRFEFGVALVDVFPGALTGGDFTFGGASVDTIGLEVFGIGSSVPTGTATALASARFTLSADASGLVCPFDEGQGDTDIIINSGGTITLQPGKYRIVAACTRQADVLDYELYNLTTGTVLERYSVNNTGSAVSGNKVPYYLNISEVTEIQIREGDVSTSVIWNGREAGIDVGFNNTMRPYSCYIDIQQESTFGLTIPAEASIVDESANNYFDIAGMRRQWGVVSGATGNQTVVLPAPFADSTYIVFINVQDSGQFSGVVFSGNPHSKTPNQFECDLQFSNGGVPSSAIEDWSWFAIGLKP